MDALSPHATGSRCRTVQRAIADCLSSLRSFTKQDYAGLKALDVLKVFSSLAGMARLTGMPYYPHVRLVTHSRLSGSGSCRPVLRACTVFLSRA